MTKIQSELNKIAMNFNAKQDIFNTTFINQEKGLKEVMLLIDESLKINQEQIINYCIQILLNIFSYIQGIDHIRDKQEQYFKMFFNLTSDMTHIRKNILRIFYQIANRLQDSFDFIVDKAEELAGSSKPKTKPFQTLFENLDLSKETIALSALKFIN